MRDRSGGTSATRDGSFVRERNGTLTDPWGRTLLDRNGAPVRLRDGEKLDGYRLGLPSRSRLCSGFLETSGADAISAMIDVMGAQRSFESAQKVVAAIDGVRGKASESARVH